MRFLSIVLLSAAVLCSSCATLLNSKYQPVSIIDKHQSNVVINGKAPKMKNDRYLLERNLKSQQISFKKEGYKDLHIALVQYKRPILYAVSWVPFGIFTFGFVPLLDNGVKAYDYDRYVNVNDFLLPIPQHQPASKGLQINKLNFKIDPENRMYRDFYSYRSFLSQKDSRKTYTKKESEQVKVENSVFVMDLNEFLKNNGYIDTTMRLSKFSYLDNVSLDATVSSYTLNHIINNKQQRLSHIIYVSLNTQWQVLDVYNNVLDTIETTSNSGHFSVKGNDKKDQEKVFDLAVKDALEYGLLDLISSDRMVNILKDRSDIDQEASFETIRLGKAPLYAEGLSQAINASVTIKNKKGHGSGFVATSDGFIITNYHVVSDTTGLSVVTANGNVYPASVVRASKVYDLALVKIEATDLVPMQISHNRDIVVASDVYAVGTPTMEDLSQTISRGIISGVRAAHTDSKLIQTDASVSPGNSGGAILDKNGVVTGVVSSKLKGFGIEGVAFGIPAYEIYDRLKLVIE